MMKSREMEQILRIEETTFKKTNDSWRSYDGYQVVTENQTIKVGISNEQCCCEEWGYLMSQDDISEFIGSDLIKVEIVDSALDVKQIEDVYIDCGSFMFVNFTTSNGLFQLVAYNAHNGYYAHDAVLISSQLNHEETL